MINEVTGEMIQQKWHLFVLVPEKPGHQDAELCCDVMQLLLTSPQPGKADLQSAQRCTGVSPWLNTSQIRRYYADASCRNNCIR